MPKRNSHRGCGGEVTKWLVGTEEGEVQDVALYLGPRKKGPGPFFVWGEGTVQELVGKRKKRNYVERVLGPFETYGDAASALFEIRGLPSYARFWAFGVGDDKALFSKVRDDRDAGPSEVDPSN